jgi:hypothetical protein
LYVQNTYCSSRTWRFNTANIKVRHRTRFSASSIHLRFEQSSSVRSILRLSSPLLSFTTTRFDKGFPFKILHAFLSLYTSHMRSSS